MKPTVFRLVLAATATVVIAACQQRQTGRYPQETQPDRESRPDDRRPADDGVEAAGEPQNDAGLRVAEVPDADNDIDGTRAVALGSEPEVGEGPRADEGVAGAETDKQPPLLLDDEPPLLLDDEPPLLLDDEPPLLLDDDGEEMFAPTGPVADNSRCHHCHLNFADEDLAVFHADANIGCADCHGNCDAHIADESWASGGNGTPPGIMYPREKINPACLECHPQDELSQSEHDPFFAGTAKEKYCVDCHGDHHIPGQRKCKWK